MIISLINAIDFPTWLSDTAFTIPFIDWPVKWYGISYLVGIYLAYRWAVRSVAKTEIWRPGSGTRGNEIVPTKTRLEDFAFLCLLGIMLGGRIGYIILYDLKDTLLDPISIFKVWEGGMSFHGGFIGVCLAVWWINRKDKISLWRWADMAAIGAPLGLGSVRLANFVNQELYGRATDVSWAFIFRTDPELLPRHPSQLYEAFLEGIVIFLIIWYASRKHKALTKPGLCAGLFFLFYGVFRTFVEFFREPDATLLFGLTRGMAYSIPMIIIGILIVRWAVKRPPVAPKFMTDEALAEKAKVDEFA